MTTGGDTTKSHHADRAFSGDRWNGTKRQEKGTAGGVRFRTTNHSKGVAAESIAIETLQAAGFEVLNRRYRTRAGEVDLVVAKEGALAFVEVKRRASAIQAMEAITPHQQTRIAGAAEIWLQAHPEYADRDITFDALLVCPSSTPCHIRDAFRPAI